MQIFLLDNFRQNNQIKNPAFMAYKSKVAKEVARQLERDIADFGEKLSPKKREILLREKNVFDLLASGMSQKEIAIKLNKHYTEINRIAQKFKTFQACLKERNDLILEKLRSGVSRKDVLKEFNLSKRIVDELAKSNDIFKNKVLEREIIVMERIHAGKTASVIAEELGISQSMVCRIAQKNGFPLKQNLNRLKK